MIEKLKKIVSDLTKALSEIEAKPDSQMIMKKVDTEQRLILGVVLEPDAFDLHNDIYSADEIRKASIISIPTVCVGMLNTL